MSDIVVMSFVGDLFPRQIAAPDAVAQGIASACTPDGYRHASPEIREVVRTAGEWQGTLSSRRKLFGASPPRASESDFLAAARRASERFGPPR